MTVQDLDEYQFQSTHPRGVRPAEYADSGKQWEFQSTHPRGVRPMMWTASSSWHRFQSTHPRGVRRKSPQNHRASSTVSIHAPAWGATPRTLALCRFDSEVSIHAPAWGATVDEWYLRFGLQVSIHAPAWGATYVGNGYPLGQAMFQSTHPRGVRRGPSHGRIVAFPSFNPRTRVGCDPKFSTTLRRPVRRFNPRTRVGCDIRLFDPDHVSAEVSIHAPAWGATF